MFLVDAHLRLCFSALGQVFHAADYLNVARAAQAVFTTERNAKLFARFLDGRAFLYIARLAAGGDGWHGEKIEMVVYIGCGN